FWGDADNVVVGARTEGLAAEQITASSRGQVHRQDRRVWFSDEGQVKGGATVVGQVGTLARIQLYIRAPCQVPEIIFLISGDRESAGVVVEFVQPGARRHARHDLIQRVAAGVQMVGDQLETWANREGVGLAGQAQQLHFGDMHAVSRHSIGNGGKGQPVAQVGRVVRKLNHDSLKPSCERRY